MSSKRLFMTMPEELYEQFEKNRELLGMSRSMYVRYLLQGQRELRPPTIRYVKLVDKLNDIDRELKMIAAKETLSDVDRLAVMTKLDDIKKLLNKNYGVGQIVPKSEDS